MINLYVSVTTKGNFPSHEEYIRRDQSLTACQLWFDYLCHGSLADLEFECVFISMHPISGFAVCGHVWLILNADPYLMSQTTNPSGVWRAFTIILFKGGKTKWYMGDYSPGTWDREQRNESWWAVWCWDAQEGACVCMQLMSDADTIRKKNLSYSSRWFHNCGRI